MSRPPKNCGQAAEQTGRRRAGHGLTTAQIRQAKALRDEDPQREWAEVAVLLGVAEDAVKLALAPTRSPSGKRGILNVTAEARDRFQQRFALPGEAAWEAFDRLLDDLDRLMPA